MESGEKWLKLVKSSEKVGKSGKNVVKSFPHC